MGDFMPFEFTPEMQTAVQAVSLVAVTADILAGEQLIATHGPQDPPLPLADAKENLSHARRIASELAAFMAAAGQAAEADENEFLEADTRRMRDSAVEVLEELAALLSREQVALIAVESSTSHHLPPNLVWFVGQSPGVAEGLAVLDPAYSVEVVEAIRGAHRKNSARLARKSLSPYTTGALVLGGSAAGIMAGAVLAPAVGGAIGGAMGLSGAAATSAGLAFLGGGSLASGGFGMAGGILFVTVAGKATYQGARYVATGIAIHDRKQFIFDLAKFHTAYRMLDHTAQEDRDLIRVLEEMFAEVREISNAPISRASAERRDLMGSWKNMTDWNRLKSVAASTQEANRHAAAERVIRAEISQIQNPNASIGAVAGIAALINPIQLAEVLAR